MHIVINKDLAVDAVKGLHNSTLQFRGCDNCMAEVMASYMSDNPGFRSMMVRAIAIFSIESAKKI